MVCLFVATCIAGLRLAHALRFFDIAVDADGIRYGWAGFRGGRIALDDVASVEVVRYPWIYGYGWRIAGRGVAYSIPFEREALLVRRKSGFLNRYYFTLAAPEAAREAIEAVRAA
ncbi:MAG TPA: hypothetical protein VHF22_13275, partial [Planctomycetota bacterium]|nr:hypothetical protein [Planctomycetota bacterium]